MNRYILSILFIAFSALDSFASYDNARDYSIRDGSHIPPLIILIAIILIAIVLMARIQFSKWSSKHNNTTKQDSQPNNNNLTAICPKCSGAEFAIVECERPSNIKCTHCNGYRKELPNEYFDLLKEEKQLNTLLQNNRLEELQRRTKEKARLISIINSRGEKVLSEEEIVDKISKLRQHSRGLAKSLMAEIKDNPTCDVCNGEDKNCPSCLGTKKIINASQFDTAKTVLSIYEEIKQLRADYAFYFFPPLGFMSGSFLFTSKLNEIYENAESCHECNGTGMILPPNIYYDHGKFYTKKECVYCQGKGFYHSR